VSSELEVLGVDNHLLVVAKPACAPCVADESGDESLHERARRWVEVEFDKPGRAFLGVVHRLDRPVSGVVLFARTSKAAARLAESFRSRAVEKRYLALVHGRPSAGPRGSLEQWLSKDARTRNVSVVQPESPGSRCARTRYAVLREQDGHSLVELVPESGRPHQLRVAMASLGSPILGDLRYGADAPLPDKSIALHAASLGLEHPVQREHVQWSAPLPDTEWWRRGARELDPS